MRYALQLSYNGKDFHGWQKQPNNKRTVQEELEKRLRTLIPSQGAFELIGCGRTDAGVHALNYIAHMDCEAPLPSDFIYHLNAICPEDLALQACMPVPSDFHARFDAIARTYEYHLHGYKSPFIDHFSYRLRQFDKLDIHILQQAADLVKKHTLFFPFCLSNSGVEHYEVNLIQAHWQADHYNKLVFTITANRFLRGMVRLITGMCINVALKQVTLDEVQYALEQQTLLSKSLSVPAHGLYLTYITYPADKITFDQKGYGDQHFLK